MNREALDEYLLSDVAFVQVDMEMAELKQALGVGGG